MKEIPADIHYSGDLQQLSITHNKLNFFPSTALRPLFHLQVLTTAAINNSRWQICKMPNDLPRYICQQKLTFEKQVNCNNLQTMSHQLIENDRADSSSE